MKKILVLLIISITLAASGDQFVVVQKDHTDLIDKKGVQKVRLQKGEVVRVKNHNSDHKYYLVSFKNGSYAAPKSSFREVSSVFLEEKRLLGEIDNTHETIHTLEAKVLSLKEQNSLYRKKITELQIWIEVQRDLSFSREFFIRKTSKSVEVLKKLKLKSQETESEINEFNRQILEEKESLEAFENSFETLQSKLKSLKKEKAFYHKSFVEVEVIAEAPVFLNGKIVKYLSSNTKLKVKKDRNLHGWYVFFKNNKPHYIASENVMVRQS